MVSMCQQLILCTTMDTLKLQIHLEVTSITKGLGIFIVIYCKKKDIILLLIAGVKIGVVIH